MPLAPGQLEHLSVEARVEGADPRWQDFRLSPAQLADRVAASVG